MTVVVVRDGSECCSIICITRVSSLIFELETVLNCTLSFFRFEVCAVCIYDAVWPVRYGFSPILRIINLI